MAISNRTYIGSSAGDSGAATPDELTFTIMPAQTGIVQEAIGVMFVANHPCDNFRDADITAIWKRRNDAIDEGVIGELGTIGVNDGQRVYTAQWTPPPGKRGRCEIIIQPNAAEFSSDMTIVGPPEAVIETIEYDTVKTIVIPTVEIVPPPTTVHVGLTYRVRFIFSQPISAFALNDDAMLSDITIVNGTIANLENADNGNGRIWEADITYASNQTGSVTVTVKANSVQLQGGRAPMADTAEMWQFDSRTAAQNRTVTGGTQVSTHTETIASGDFVFNGVLESIADDTYLYKVEQLLDIIDATPNKFPNEEKMASAQLVRVTLSDGTRTVIKKWDYVTTAARSLYFKDDKLHWFEGSHYADILNDNIDFELEHDNDTGFNERLRQYDWKEAMGKLYRLDGTTVEEVGQVHRSAFTNPDADEAERDGRYGVHIGTASPIVEVPAVGKPLSVVAGYGDFRNIGDIDDPVSLAGNWQESLYGEFLNYRIPELLTNGKTGHQVCEAIAKTFNLLIGFDGRTFIARPATPAQAVLSGSLSKTATSFNISDLNRLSPQQGMHAESGYLRSIALIENELIDFSRYRSPQLRSVTRGQYGTEAAAHNPNTPIYFIDFAIPLDLSTLEMPINAINFSRNSQVFYNVCKIYDNHGQLLVSKPDSEPENPSVLTIHSLFGAHQSIEATHIAEDYLKRFGHERLQANITLKYFPRLKVGMVVYFDTPTERGFSRACELTSVVHNLQERTTELTVLTI